MAAGRNRRLRLAVPGMVMGLTIALAGVSPASAAAPTITIDGKRHTCTIVGTSRADRLEGTSRNDVICGKDGNDTIDGAGGNDIISGGSGSDTITAGSGNDTIKGDSGNDSISGSTGDDMIAGGTGNDTIKGESGNDRVDGLTGNDTLDGGDGRDRLDGGTGSDQCLRDAMDTSVSSSCPTLYPSTFRPLSATVVDRGTPKMIRFTMRVAAKADVFDVWAYLYNGTDYLCVGPDRNDSLRSGNVRDGIWNLETYVYPKTPIGDYRLIELAAEANTKGGSTRVRITSPKTVLTVTDSAGSAPS